MLVLKTDGDPIMIPLDSHIENIQGTYCDLNEYFCQMNFCLSGNWEYKKGIFDKFLDAERKVWLRVPFEVMSGRLDGECDGCDAIVKLGKPYVLNHLYNEGLDDEANISMTGGLFNQFQAPVDPDAPVKSRWVTQAEELLHQLEQTIVH
ncbi:YugN family protein [Paenibacillus guangzhouensis]|uniref:YugN family protein n=1 Tax=Paenibacillus guangzhouensis TaxID=1473112 RepID=UPI001D126C5C|nr:YugN family protein [Paenibacillus guangzhouensis]